MNISPVNYQMGITQNNSLKQNDSVNFQSKSSAAKETLRTVRYKRTYYHKGEKPLWNDLLKKLIKGSTKQEESIYNIFGDKKTVYYNYKNKVMATVYDINGKNKRLILSTPKRDYTDKGKTGVIDYFDEDQEIIDRTVRTPNFIDKFESKYRFLYGLGLNFDKITK